MSRFESLRNRTVENPGRKIAGVLLAGAALSACTAKASPAETVPSPTECSPVVVSEGSNTTEAVNAAAVAAFEQAKSRGEDGTNRTSDSFLRDARQPLAAAINEAISNNEISRYSSPNEELTVCIDPATEHSDNVTVGPRNQEGIIRE